MAHDSTDRNSLVGTPVRRRTVLGGVLAAGFFGSMIIGTGTARADSGTDSVEDEEYPIPDETGSAPWW